MGALGDISRGISVLKPIKNHFDKVHITWVTHNTWKSFLELHEDIDEILTFDKTFKGALSLRAELKQRNFDICLDLQRNLKSGITSFLTGAKRRIGFHKSNSKEFNFLFNNESIKHFSEETPKIINYLDFLRVLDIKKVEEVNFGLNKEKYLKSLANLNANFKDEFIAIILGSSWDSKDWFISGYQSLIQIILNESKLNVVLLGAGKQVKTGEKIETHFSNARVINLAGKTNLQQMAGILSKAKASVGPDSGPGHVSSAVNVPYISIFGPTNPNRVAPFKSENFVVKSKLACSPCWKRKCPGLNRLCMRLVSGRQVWEMVKLSF